MRISSFVIATILITSAAHVQFTKDPFSTPIPATEAAILVRFAEFAKIPHIGAAAPRMTLLVDEPSTHRLFVNTETGPLYSVSYDGKRVIQYLDLNAPMSGANVQSSSHDRGFQSFAWVWCKLRCSVF